MIRWHHTVRRWRGGNKICLLLGVLGAGCRGQLCGCGWGGFAGVSREFVVTKVGTSNILQNDEGHLCMIICVGDLGWSCVVLVYYLP